MQNKDYPRLLDCPFCGGIGTLWSIDQCDTVYAVCQNCGARTVDYKYAEEAISAWNRRAQPANEPLVRCGECAKYQSPQCAAKHEQALMDFCSHGIHKPGCEQI